MSPSRMPSPNSTLLCTAHACGRRFSVGAQNARAARTCTLPPPPHPTPGAPPPRALSRYYHSPSLVNYGAIPQTWEDGDHVDAKLNLKGDNDPLDVLEIGSAPCTQGDIYAVKALGILGMVDGGEMDWKVVVIATSDPLAATLTGAPRSSCARVHTRAARWLRVCSPLQLVGCCLRQCKGTTTYVRLGLCVCVRTRVCAYVWADVGHQNKNSNPAVQEFLNQVRVWFRDYKIPDGKPANEFAFDDQYQSKVWFKCCAPRRPECPPGVGSHSRARAHTSRRLLHRRGRPFLRALSCA
jgi:hypothetical protein